MTLPPHVSAAVQQTDVTPEDELTCITFTPAAPSRLHIHNLTVETNCSIKLQHQTAASQLTSVTTAAL